MKNQVSEALHKAKMSTLGAKKQNEKTSVTKSLLTKDYTKVPGFTKYGVTKDGKLISISTGNIQQIPTGKKKYLIYADDGKRKPISMDDILKLLPKKSKALKEKKAKTPAISDERIKELKAKPEIKTILESDDKKHYKIFMLNKKSLDNKEIAILLGTNTGHVYNELKRYEENPNRKC